MGAGRLSVWSSSIDGQSSGEDVGPADVSESALNLNTNPAVTTGGGRTTTERKTAVRRSLGDGGKEICVPLSASQSESPEADTDVCACCGASLEEEDDCPGDPGEHLHGSPFEAAHAGMVCSFVEEMETNDMRDGAEVMGSCLMPGQLAQHHYWYPCVCPPNPHALPPLGPRHPTRRYCRWSDFWFILCEKHLVFLQTPVHVSVGCGTEQQVSAHVVSWKGLHAPFMTLRGTEAMSEPPTTGPPLA